MRRCADTSVATGCDACAGRIPCGAVCALVPAAGKPKVPAKASNIAAVLIRIITPTMNLLWAATSPIAAPTSTARKTVCTRPEHALNRQNVD
jgi:hypothetical protein